MTKQNKKELESFLKKIGYWEGGDYIGIEVKNKNKPNIELQGISVNEFKSLLKKAINFGKDSKELTGEQTDKILKKIEDYGFKIIDLQLGHKEQLNIFNIQVISEEYFNEKVNEALE